MSNAEVGKPKKSEDSGANQPAEEKSKSLLTTMEQAMAMVKVTENHHKKMNIEVDNFIRRKQADYDRLVLETEKIIGQMSVKDQATLRAELFTAEQEKAKERQEVQGINRKRAREIVKQQRKAKLGPRKKRR